MNAAVNSMLANELSLPLKGPGRRHRINDRPLDFEKLSVFNTTLRGIDHRVAQVDADQIVTLARSVSDSTTNNPSIREQLSRVDRVRAMLADPDWDCPADLRQRAERLLAYVSEVHDLIPDTDAKLGHLDDALLVSLTWRAFSGEVEDYEDFTAFQIAHSPRGTAYERRLIWLNARLEEALMLRHRQDVRYGSFVPQVALDSPLRVV